MSVAITDLDELVLRVRDIESKVLYAEAIQAYRAGALRAAVTAVWISVVYDLIAKIRELSLGGDKNATKFVEALDRAVAQEDVPALQRIEGAILDTAADDFELLSAHEKVDLERLRDDRNLCAHPALVAEHTIFQPTPELTRAHLVHVGLHVL
ncbi:MAG TPA: hypothetical protein VEU33_44290, partial [Archangium sp.]|nr:hypothetical protein [Archangium sp.]